MTDETENLVLELLRSMRSDTAELKRDVSAIRERLDAIDLQLEGWRYVFVATTGSLVTDMKDHDTRIDALEGVQP